MKNEVCGPFSLKPYHQNTELQRLELLSNTKLVYGLGFGTLILETALLICDPKSQNFSLIIFKTISCLIILRFVYQF